MYEFSETAVDERGATLVVDRGLVVDRSAINRSRKPDIC